MRRTFAVLGCALMLLASGLTLGSEAGPATAAPTATPTATSWAAAKPRHHQGQHSHATPWRPVEGGFFNNP